MKIKNLVIVFGLGVLGFISCSKDEIVSLDPATTESEVRGDGDGPEVCCDFDWVIQSTENEIGCCTYNILVNNYGNCQIQIVGFPNGFVGAQTSRVFEVTVCGKLATTFNVYSSVNQTSVPCGSIELAADCSTEAPCNEDCVFSFQTVDQGKDVQFTSALKIIDDCEEINSADYCGSGGGSVIIKNESGCSDQEVRDIWNAYGFDPFMYPMGFPSYQSCVETVIKARKGCENAQVNVELNNQGGIDYEITYDCATCELIFIQAVEKAFDVTNDCVGIVFPTATTSAGGTTNCGACE